MFSSQVHLLGLAWDSTLDDLDLGAFGDLDLDIDIDLDLDLDLDLDIDIDIDLDLDLDLDLELAAGDSEPCLEDPNDDLLLLLAGEPGLVGDPEIEREFLGLFFDFDLCLDIDLERDLDFDLDIDLDADLDLDLETDSGKLDLDLDLDIACLGAPFSVELA